MKKTLSVLVLTLVLVSLQQAEHPAQAQSDSPFWTIEERATTEGYASSQSINRGESVSFHVHTVAPSYDLDVYRIGWYGGTGGRLVHAVEDLPGAQRPVPAPDPATGMIEANWPVSYTLTTGSTWASGYYVARMTPSDGSEPGSIPFIVRDDSSTADIIYIVPFTTYQAYNAWGTKSLYDSNSTGENSNGHTRAYKVSYNRPYDLQGGLKYLYSGDYQMIRWLEREGYDVTYAANVDLHRNPSLYQTHKVLLANYHDEYYTWEMRGTVEAARDANVDLTYFTSNNIYWQMRWESSPTTGAPYRVVTCYKDATLDPINADGSTANDYLTTVLFRDPPVNAPENELLGVMYDGDFGDEINFDLIITNADHPSYTWVFDGTGLTNGSVVPEVIGDEFDKVFNNGFTPPGQVSLSNSPIVYPEFGIDSVQNMSIYQAASGAYVFNASTNRWALKLDDTKWDATLDVAPSLQQMTRNLLNRMIGGGYTPTPWTGDSYIYDDATTYEWFNNNSPADLSDTTEAFSGRRSIRVDFEAPDIAEDPDSRLSLRTDTPIDISGYTTLEFAAKATLENQQLVLFFLDGSENVETTETLVISDYGFPSTTDWTYYRLPISDFYDGDTTATQSVKFFFIVAASQYGTVYFDNIRFTNAPVDSTPPTLTGTIPADDSTFISVDTDLTLIFDEEVKAGSGNITVKLTSDDSPVQTVDVSQAAINGNTAVIDLPSDLSISTDYYVQVDSGAFTDIFGNPYGGIGSKTAWNFQTADKVDITPPTVLTLSPEDNASGVELDANLVIQFTETVQKGTSGSITVYDTNDAVVQSIAVTDAAVDVAGDTATIDLPSNLDDSAGYYVLVDAGAFEDPGNNPFAGISSPLVWNFTTLDSTPPAVFRRTPPNNAVDVAVDTNLSVRFTETVQRGVSGSIILHEAGGAVVASWDINGGDVTVAGDTVTINPAFDLAYGISYTVSIDSGALVDTSGNPFGGLSSEQWKFTTAAQPTQQAQITAFDAGTDHWFGSGAAVDGDTLVVGAYGEDGYSGALYVYERAGANRWQLRQKLKVSGASDIGFVVDINNDTIITSSFTEDNAAGAAYVFTRSGSTWTQQQRLVASDRADGDEFGNDVAVSGDTAVISASQAANAQGAAYIFTRSGSTWTQTAKLTAGDAANGENFGQQVAIAGEIAIVSAPGDNNDQGAIYFFRGSAGWSQRLKLGAADGLPGEQFGFSVALDDAGNRAVVGAVGDDGDLGAAYVIGGSGDTWAQEAKLTLEERDVGEFFGGAVDIDGDKIIIGAYESFREDLFAGVSYVFLNIGGSTWQQHTTIIPSDRTRADYFGWSTAIEGDAVLIGAYSAPVDALTRAGKVYAYSVPTRTRDVNADGAVTPADALFVINRIGNTPTGEDAPADINGDGDIDTNDANAVLNVIGTK